MLRPGPWYGRHHLQPPTSIGSIRHLRSTMSLDQSCRWMTRTNTVIEPLQYVSWHIASHGCLAEATQHFVTSIQHVLLVSDFICECICLASPYNPSSNHNTTTTITTTTTTIIQYCHFNQRIHSANKQRNVSISVN
ncbi:hypothetical protein J1614_008161 [Plenodomus biglobosus]|nr:hypothetical protein J1614_008161 [Plenodomus biglobosus]